MKRLVLVRHAKAVPWGYDEDFNRELTERGESDARKVSRALIKRGVIPGLMMTSPAMRTLQTAIIFAAEFGYPEKSFHKNRSLYLGMTSGELAEMVHRLDEEWNCLFIFGHNPALSYQARAFCRDFSGEMPTCSTVVIDFPVDRWDEVTPQSGVLFHQFNPKELQD